MRKVIRLLFSFLFLFALFSCNTKANQISVFYYDKDDIFLTQLSKKLTDKLSSDYKITNYYSDKSQLNQNLQVDEALNKSSLILMNMVDRLASGAIVEKCKLKVTYPETIEGLDRAIRRFWALMQLTLENNPIAKIYSSGDYFLFRSVNVQPIPPVKPV